MLNDILDTVQLHIKRAQNAKNEILKWGDFNVHVFEDSDKVRTIDSFIYRFIKLQDLTGQKVFKIYLDEIGEYRDDMSLLDVLDKLEKLKILDNSKQWMEFRKLRNELTHEYPDNETEIVEGIKLALDAFEQTLQIIDNLIAHRNHRSN